MLPCVSNTAICLANKVTTGGYSGLKIIVPVLCACMIAARGLAAISGDLVRRLIPGNVSDTITEPIVSAVFDLHTSVFNKTL